MLSFFVTELDIDDIANLKQELAGADFIEIIFPFDSIGRTQSYLDIIEDYLVVSFCCEKLTNCICVNRSDFSKHGIHSTFSIECKIIDPDIFTQHLVYFYEMLTQELSEYDDLDVISFYNKIRTYRKSLKTKNFTFPEIINGYWVNLINGAYHEMAFDEDEYGKYFLSKVYSRNPEHRYGFWKSPHSHVYQGEIYFSSENWIIPPGSDISSALKLYSIIENLNIEEADCVKFNNTTVLISTSAAVHFKRYSRLFDSIACAELIHKKKLNKTTKQTDRGCSRIASSQYDLFGNPIKHRTSKPRPNYDTDIQVDLSRVRYQLSESGDVIIVWYDGFAYIFFDGQTLSFNELKEVHSFLFPAYSKLEQLIDKSISESCNWGKLNDDSFEELCYDLLYCHPAFDSRSIQKIGKSRSRDGGRDITIKSRKTPTGEQDLFIFQCKFHSNQSSLTASKIPNAANVIMQYGAKGYGVFTNTVIDATLYDMLDGFSRNMAINTNYRWSKYEIERHLNRRLKIKSKYFK